MRSHVQLLPLLFCISCGSEENDPYGDLPWDSTPTCGDGIIDANELCDDGEQNSDSLPDACRTDCMQARCGDDVVDSNEVCDDGDPRGGDGCSAYCLPEYGDSEVEPNDQPWEAKEFESDTILHGSLAEFDLDCFKYSVPIWGWVHAEVLPDKDDVCLSGHALSLRDIKGNIIHQAYSRDMESGCATLNAFVVPEAQYLDQEEYAICVEGTSGSKILSYSLRTHIGDDSCDETFEVAPLKDIDGDGLHHACDPDDDNDGIDDAQDNCPEVSNSTLTDTWYTTNKGYINRWLLSGPYTGTEAPEECEPSRGSVTYFRDGEVTPAIADDVPGVPWVAAIEWDDRINFFHYIASSAPHEAYAVTWVRSPEAREATLAMGADDGFRVWFDGVELDSVSKCQGVSADKYKYPVTLSEGWHRLTIRVRDHGGQWGVMARFLDGETGKSLNDLELSIHPYGPWIDDQSDSDGDGVGDACDLRPNNPDES